ncbi:DUF397 domain-containing protein [Catenuloplanes atrovinosus]|uniref:DUF397 domain-containing protein n=1 Tax=Catenuloplanes atrovinosus TaxID=137266 RepID=A0AAE3YS35_9ACTN|nr:DUF397 domain-containing protein [Catenuloplanes atrovinosus]MDR7278948.1 hypothetical protein [Catenuloplanes atrovinosus]
MITHIPDASTIAVEWHKSSRSASHGQCLEVADLGDTIALRNSREPTGPALVLTVGEMEAFVEGAKSGEFDRYYIFRR